jgi:dTDP-4-dehydrorhamnose reductase
VTDLRFPRPVPSRYPVPVMAKRAVVLGSLGQLGTELVRDLERRGWQTWGFDRRELDITQRRAVEERIAELDPEVVFNAAAYNQVDVAEEEPEAAFAVNALAVRNIALACRQTGALLVHYSTDYVFDGRAERPYTEEDPPHPLSAYAVSKLAGELYAQAYLDRWIIIRTSGVYGPGGLRTARGNFIELMLRLAQEGKPIRVVEDHIASPTYAPALAARSLDLVERGLTGLFHIGGGTPISWFDWARMIFQVAGVRAELQPTNEREYRTAARRPKYSALSNAKIERLGLAPMPPLEEALRSYMILRRAALSARQETGAP